MGFATDDEVFAASRLDDEPYVIVPVARHLGALGNPVPIEIEDLALHVEIGQAGFFFCFSQCHTRKISVAVCMATELQPSIKLAVVGQQHAQTVGAHEPCGSREMPIKVAAQKTFFCIQLRTE